MIIEDYKFEGYNITYPDGHVINIENINPIFIGYLKAHNSKYNASIITLNAIKKFKYTPSENIEAISFIFNENINCIKCVNYLNNLF